MNEMHLGVLLGLLVLVLARLAMSCIFGHGTGTIEGTIQDNTYFLPGRRGGGEGRCVSEWWNIELDNAAIERGRGGGIGVGTSIEHGSLIGEELDGSLHIDCFLLVVYG